MERGRPILGIDLCYDDEEIVCLVKGFYFTVPFPWVLAVCKDVFLYRKTLVSTVPVDHSVIGKIGTDLSPVLFQYCFYEASVIKHGISSNSQIGSHQFEHFPYGIFYQVKKSLINTYPSSIVSERQKPCFIQNSCAAICSIFTGAEILQAENSLCKYSIQSFTAFDPYPLL